MIRNSFVLLDRIGLQKERAIWDSNVLNWDDFIASKKVNLVGSLSKFFYDRQLEKAKRQLAADDSLFFSDVLPFSEHWRLYEWFRDQSVFLDIETTGLGHYDDVTVVGLYDGLDTKSMIKGVNLNFKLLEEELKKYKMIVTFNGGSFDVPFLRKFIDVPNVPHLDLRFACKKLGLDGGLKAIEKKVGIERKNEVVSQMHGGDAAQLWRMYRGSGDDYYLNLLVEYNEEDVINLKPLADHVFAELKKNTFPNGKM